METESGTKKAMKATAESKEKNYKTHQGCEVQVCSTCCPLVILNWVTLIFYELIDLISLLRQCSFKFQSISGCNSFLNYTKRFY